jgi:general secretion pathway protein J
MARFVLHDQRRAAAGFTLVEILVALFIFAIVGLIGTQLISRVTIQQTVLSERGARLIEVQRAMQILRRDFMQIQNRPVRDGFGDIRPSLVLDDDNLLEFTRLGWRNPLQQPRADEQRVAYGFDVRNRELVRYFWSVLDRAQDSEPIRQVLLSNVDAAQFLLITSDGTKHEYWPRVAEGAPGAVSVAGIALRLELKPYGQINRLWEVPAG